MRVAIGVSGGLDSTIAYHWALTQNLTPLPIFVNLGHPYAEKERQTLTRLGIPFTEVFANVCSITPHPPTVGRYIIPGRNTAIASILGMALPDVVWIVGMRHENHPENIDKNQQFYTTLTNTLSLTYGKPITVTSPFITQSKEDVIQWAIQQGLGDVLQKTVSCYHPTIQQCGECAACVKRYVALFGTGLDLLSNYATHPMRSEKAQNLTAVYQQCLAIGDFSRHHQDRIERFLSVSSKI